MNPPSYPPSDAMISPSYPPSDAMNSPEHSPTSLQNHLYSSFLEGSTADVALHVKGSWEAIYKLHRVVLIQAGFFRPLFTGGFSESRFTRLGPHSDVPDEITISFDDPNLTRPAFEICLSRLYGGGPPIHIPVSLIPTPSNPLTSSFPSLSQHVRPEEAPPGYCLASPRFLLSLLATSVYLSMPAIAGQALKAIINTVGPTTVIRYLNFATGKGIGPPESDALPVAIGLENIAEEVRNNDTISNSDRASIASGQQSIDIHDNDYHSETKESPAANEPMLSEDSVHSKSDGEHARSYFYGGVSNKIGEAAACWLARWGCDILSYEEDGSSWSPISSSPSPSPSSTNIPRIWARGGLDPVWVRALLSSDALFINGERERYDMSKTVVELRRRSRIDVAEEEEFDKLFAHGIHYMHMTMDDLILISRDVSPTTGKPYVPLSHLTMAIWDQSTLRHRITASSLRGKELGISIPTSTLPSLDASIHNEERNRPYFQVPADSSQRLGDSTGVERATMDQLLGTGFSDLKGANNPASTERNFFGILAERQTLASCAKTDKTSNLKWTPYPPFRFAIEFWNVESMTEKSRMHSRTVWYAGSLYNAYVQVITKKGIQLGVYLHRQSHIDPIPAFSVPQYQRPEQVKRTHHRGNSLPTTAATVHHSSSLPAIGTTNTSSMAVNRSTTPVSANGVAGSPPSASPTSLQHQSSTNSSIPYPPQPYRDPRPAVSAYFSISCCSATGSSITRFTSVPDVFGISQSWGWKSSSLRTEEYLKLDEDGLPVIGGTVDKEVSFRATVVLGVV